jgi:hypothetical protein
MSINCFTEAEDIGLAYSARRSKGLQRRSAEGPARGGVSWCVFGRGRRAYLPKRRARKVCTAWWCVVRGEGMDMQIEHGSKVKWSVSRSSGEALAMRARAGLSRNGRWLCFRGSRRAMLRCRITHLHATLQMANLVCTCPVTSTPVTCYHQRPAGIPPSHCYHPSRSYGPSASLQTRQDSSEA